MADVQTSITSRMRRILIDWMVDVHSRFTMTSETLYKSIFFLDRFLSKVEVGRNTLQLAGTLRLLRNYCIDNRCKD